MGAAERVPPGYAPVRSSLAEPSCLLCLLSLLPFVSKCSTLHPRPFLTLLTGDRVLDVQTVATAAKQAVVTCKVSAHRGSLGNQLLRGHPRRTRHGWPWLHLRPRRCFYRPRLWQFLAVSGLCVSSGLTIRRVAHAGKAGAGGDFLGSLWPKGPCRSLCPLQVGPAALDATVRTQPLGRQARRSPAKARVTGRLPLSAGGQRWPTPSACTEASTKLCDIVGFGDCILGPPNL